MPSQKSKNILGQGLLEVIVALGIIITGIIGMLSLALANKNASDEAAARLIAVNLGREAMEVVRAMRDGNWLAGLAWDAGFYSGTDYSAALFYDQTANAWSLDFRPNDLNHDLARVWLQADAGNPEAAIYRQAEFITVPDNTTLTVYRRLLTLDPICQNKTVVESGSSCPGEKIGLRLQARLSWVFKDRPRSAVFEERIFNWR